MSDPNSVRSLPLESQTRPTLVAEMFHCSFLWTPSPERDSLAFFPGSIGSLAFLVMVDLLTLNTTFPVKGTKKLQTMVEE